MAESSTIFCEPCEHSGLFLHASLWCNDCGEGFCEECIKGHKLTKVLRNHHIVSITDHLEVSDLNVNQTCPNHSKPFENFCPQHDKLLCLKCVQLGEHGKCGDLLRIHDAVKGVKSSTAISEIEESISSILQNITRSLKKNNENGLGNQKEAIKSKINDTREKIIIKLDQLQEKLLNELETQFQKAASECDKFKDQLKRNEQKIHQLKTQLNRIKTHVSDIQTFIAMKTIEKSIYSEKVKVQANMRKLQQYHLELKTNPNLTSVMDELQNFGEIIVNIKSDCTHYTEPHDKQAQQDVLPTSDIEKIRLEKMLDVKIKTGRKALHIVDCVILPTQQMVFTDYSKTTLIIHNIDGIYEKEVLLSKKPRYITVVDTDTVAVTYDFPTLHYDVINIRTNKTEKTLSAGKNNRHRGLSYCDGKFYVAVENEGVKVVTLDGTVTNTILTKVKHIGRIKVSNERLYYTCYDSNKVHCCDLTGNQLWCFTDNRIYRQFVSAQLTVDGRGNVFVVGVDSSVVLAISSDGQNGRVLLDRSNGLNEPYAISFEEGYNRLLVYNRENKCAYLYEFQKCIQTI